MIVYFSATGNTEFIARELAKRLDDECVNILHRVKTNDHTPLYSEKPYIICAPVYVCEMPRFMAKYLKRQKFQGSKEVYFVFTSGGYCGISGLLAKWMFVKKWKRFKGYTEVKLPETMWPTIPIQCCLLRKLKAESPMPTSSWMILRLLLHPAGNGRQSERLNCGRFL